MYKNLFENYIFIVFAVDMMMEGWCSDVKHLTSEIGNKLKFLTGDPRSTEFLRQKLGLAIQHGNAARSVMGTFPDSIPFKDFLIFFTSLLFFLITPFLVMEPPSFCFI